MKKVLNIQNKKNMSTEYYEILNVSKTASKEEIRSSYLNLAKTLHPDKIGGDKEKFQKIQAAYETLFDENKRREYDNQSNSGHHFNPGGIPQNINPFNFFNFITAKIIEIFFRPFY